ncbi:manganese superoxide dismutase [Lactifluus subvellereus]|nr:manganese superoxide dismutase [Lactifluus subvellereus]
MILSRARSFSFPHPAFVRSLSQRAAAPHRLPELPYPHNALEPYISTEIMKLHHLKHHQAYVDGLNAAEESYVKAPLTRDKIALQPALKFHGGGHINHTLFWKNLAPVEQGGGKLSDGKFKAALERDFGSVDAFKKQFNAATVGIQGSGWGWLGYNGKTKKLEIVTTPNQDPLLSACLLSFSTILLPIEFQAHDPIIGIDIWEHAFYLQVRYSLFANTCSRSNAYLLTCQYKNVKADYLNAIWNVINFEEAEARFVKVA